MQAGTLAHCLCLFGSALEAVLGGAESHQTEFGVEVRGHHADAEVPLHDARQCGASTQDGLSRRGSCRSTRTTQPGSAECDVVQQRLGGHRHLDTPGDILA